MTSTIWKVEWVEYSRRFVTDKYALWHYGRSIPSAMDPKLDQYRKAISARKPWKIVTKGWFEHVLSHWHLGLTWKDKEVKRRVKWAEPPPIGYRANYDSDIPNQLFSQPLPKGQYLAVTKYDIFYTNRKGWKRISDTHLRVVIDNLGGIV